MKDSRLLCCCCGTDKDTDFYPYIDNGVWLCSRCANSPEVVASINSVLKKTVVEIKKQKPIQL